MSRHRAVRGMNLDDEYDDEDDYYGHSVEDNFCISPGTAAQFTFNRDQHTFGTYMGGEEPVEEESEEEAEKEEISTTKVRSQLSDVNKAQLNSCLEEIHNILGESRPDSVYIDTVIKHNYNLQAALDELLSLKEAPKPQRAPRQNRRNRSQGESDDEEDDMVDSHIETPENDLDRVLSKTSLSKEESVPQSVTNLSKPLSNLSLADLAKCQKDSSGLKVNQDWLQNNVCQSSSIPKVSGLTMALGHMKVAKNATNNEETEVFESNSVESSQKERKLVLDSSGRSPKSSLSSSAGSEPGLSLSQLASLHQQQKSSGTSLAALAGQRSGQQVSLGSLQQASQSNKSIGSFQGQTTLNTEPQVSLSNLTSKNQMAGPAAGLSLADLAKQHSTTKQATMSLSDLAKSRNIPSSQGFNKLGDNDNCTSKPTNTASNTSSGLSLSQLASSQKSGLGSLGQASVTSGVSLSGLANAHLQPGGGSLLSCLKLDPQTTSLTNLTKNKIQLSKLQFSSEEGTPSPEVEMLESPMCTEEISLLTPIHYDKSLLSVPSVLGKALCLLKNRKRKVEDSNIKYTKFAFSAQSKRCKYQSPLHKRQFRVFDFSTPSPDDLVKQKQKGAFTRTGERHIST